MSKEIGYVVIHVHHEQRRGGRETPETQGRRRTDVREMQKKGQENQTTAILALVAPSVILINIYSVPTVYPGRVKSTLYVYQLL